MSKWLCKLNGLICCPFTYTYFKHVSSGAIAVFGERVTKGLRKERGLYIWGATISHLWIVTTLWTMGSVLEPHRPGALYSLFSGT